MTETTFTPIWEGYKWIQKRAARKGHILKVIWNFWSLITGYIEFRGYSPAHQHRVAHTAKWLLPAMQSRAQFIERRDQK